MKFCLLNCTNKTGAAIQLLESASLKTPFPAYIWSKTFYTLMSSDFIICRKTISRINRGNKCESSHRMWVSKILEVLPIPEFKYSGKDLEWRRFFWVISMISIWQSVNMKFFPWFLNQRHEKKSSILCLRDASFPIRFKKPLASVSRPLAVIWLNFLSITSFCAKIPIMLQVEFILFPMRFSN